MQFHIFQTIEAIVDIPLALELQGGVNRRGRDKALRDEVIRRCQGGQI